MDGLSEGDGVMMGLKDSLLLTPLYYAVEKKGELDGYIRKNYKNSSFCWYHFFKTWNMKKRKWQIRDYA